MLFCWVCAAVRRAIAREKLKWRRRFGGVLALVLVLSLQVNATAAAQHRCPPGSEWVKAHRNPVGHWIKGHCFITRPAQRAAPSAAMTTSLGEALP
jgi:hypothetical protein